MADCERRIKKKFDLGCVDFHLLEDGDRILIALSGGKDSLMLARLMAQRSRIYKPKIEVEAAHVIMDNIPYETDRTYLQEFCNELGIRLHILLMRVPIHERHVVSFVLGIVERLFSSLPWLMALTR